MVVGMKKYNFERMPQTYDEAVLLLNEFSTYKSVYEFAKDLSIHGKSLWRRIKRAEEIVAVPIAKEPVIMFWDIETAMMENIVKTYDLKMYSNYLPHKTISRPVTIVCASWKQKGKNTIGVSSVLHDKKRFKECHYDDYTVVKALADVVNHADIIVAHNGDKFDWRRLQARCLYHGIPAPKKPLMIDTLKIARREFYLESNSLSYLARYLKIDDKDETPDWYKVFEGDVDEIKNCIEYNKQDVLVLEQIYLRLLNLGYIRNHPNLNVIQQTTDCCKACGHDKLKEIGFEDKTTTRYKLLRCDNCNTINRHRVNVSGKINLR
jgi:uncharacterized protein YprB with RNaseH-like and TPR domain